MRNELASRRRGARHEVDALLAAAAMLSKNAGTEEILKTLVEQAAGLLNVEMARYVVGNATNFTSSQLWRDGCWIEDFYEGTPSNAGGHVWRTNRPYRTNDPAADPDADRARLAVHNIRSLMVLPLIGRRNERLGLLILANSRHPDGFSEHDERLMVAFCRFACVILRRTRGVAAHMRAEHEAAQRRREVEALLAVADQLNSAVGSEEVLQRVVEVAAELFAVRRVSVVTNEGDIALRRYSWADAVWERQDVPLPLDSSINGWVIQHAAPYRSHDLTHDPLFYLPALTGNLGGTLLSVPVLGRDRAVLAVLNLSNRRDGSQFSDDDLRLAEGIAHHTAAALERATLTDELQRTTRAVALLEERERVAMDLHDGAIQSLYGVVLRLGAQMRSPANSEQSSKALVSAVSSITAVIQEVRDYIIGLRSAEDVEAGLIAGQSMIGEENGPK